jgi:hypothetical protein
VRHRLTRFKASAGEVAAEALSGDTDLVASGWKVPDNIAAFRWRTVDEVIRAGASTQQVGTSTALQRIEIVYG